MLEDLEQKSGDYVHFIYIKIGYLSEYYNN